MKKCKEFAKETEAHYETLSRNKYRIFKDKIKLLQLIQNLKYPVEETHQIAFCTDKSINLLLEYSEDIYTKTEKFVSKLSVALISEYNMPHIEAMKLVYHSDIFTKIADENSGFYKKSWQELYELLKQELK